MAESRAEKSLKPKSKSKKSKSKKHKIRTMHIQPAENGGFVATHDHEPDGDEEGEGQNPPSSIHALGDVDQLQQHIQDHFGSGGAAAGGAAPAAQAAPAAGPGGM